MRIRPATLSDKSVLAVLLANGNFWSGEIYCRDLDLEEKLVQSELAFGAEEDGTPANYWFVAETEDGVLALAELQTLTGYDEHCLSYSRGQLLHRSDALGICHSQSYLSLDCGLLGADSISFCVGASADMTVFNAMVGHIVAFRAIHKSALVVALPGSNGPAFWQATGEPLIGVGFGDLRFAHAELLPQSPLLACFIEPALLKAGSLPALAQTLAGLGFESSGRLAPLDGGAVWWLTPARV